jgi:hypothetical protein
MAPLAGIAPLAPISTVPTGTCVGRLVPELPNPFDGICGVFPMAVESGICPESANFNVTLYNREIAAI